MSTKPAANEAVVIAFRDGAAFAAWLDANADLQAGVWLKIAKKGSGVPSLAADEAVDIGLCYGWISGRRRTWDDVYYLQKYVPRRPRSRWSQVNVANVEQLSAAGRMRPSGLAEVGGSQSRRQMGRRIRVATQRHRPTRSRRRPEGEPTGGAGVCRAQQDRPVRRDPETCHRPHHHGPCRRAAQSDDRARSM